MVLQASSVGRYHLGCLLARYEMRNGGKIVRSTPDMTGGTWIIGATCVCWLERVIADGTRLLCGVRVVC